MNLFVVAPEYFSQLAMKRSLTHRLANLFQMTNWVSGVYAILRFQLEFFLFFYSA